MQAANGSRKVKFLLNIVKWVALCTRTQPLTTDNTDDTDLHGSKKSNRDHFQSGICLQFLAGCVMLTYYFSVVYVALSRSEKHRQECLYYILPELCANLGSLGMVAYKSLES